MGWQYQEAEVYKPKKREPMPKYNYEAARASFKFSSLFTRPEVIESLGRVRQECNKVIDMQLFNTQTSKGREVTDNTVPPWQKWQCQVNLWIHKLYFQH